MIASSLKIKSSDFVASRDEALARLRHFNKNALADYARSRIYDHGFGKHPNVSMLSPYLRHRMISEVEVIESVLENFSYNDVEKFIQEVCWRTYWKGWLEHRPQIWKNFLTQYQLEHEKYQKNESYLNAIRGNTKIECFDGWVQELIQTGYLHNHSRMWFASIWIFTLKLPWTLGAMFFYRHLLDGDPASNTLSWRWVAGLHTKGKTYLARPDNISKYTSGMYKPEGLATCASPVTATDDIEEPSSLNYLLSLPDPSYPLIIWPDDMSVDMFKDSKLSKNIAIVCPEWERPNTTTKVKLFRQEAALDLSNRLRSSGKSVTFIHSIDETKSFLNQAQSNKVQWYQPFVGEGFDLAKNLTTQLGKSNVIGLRRPWDNYLFPKSHRGFFQLKKHIPKAIELCCR